MDDFDQGARGAADFRRRNGTPQTGDVGGVSAGHLKSVIEGIERLEEGIERLEEEKKALAEDFLTTPSLSCSPSCC